MLDTNAVITLMRGDHRLIARLKSRRPDEVSISSVVLHELYYGAFKSVRQLANVALVDGLRFPIIEFDADDAKVSGEVRAILSIAGAAIGPYDVLIASQALSRRLTLVTHNTREFARVAGLQVEDWEA